jgi:hypothetical protein
VPGHKDAAATIEWNCYFQDNLYSHVIGSSNSIPHISSGLQSRYTGRMLYFSIVNIILHLQGGAYMATVKPVHMLQEGFI